MLRGQEFSGARASERVVRKSWGDGDRVYQAAAGVAMSAADYAELVFARAGSLTTPLVVEEISIAGCFLLLRDDGLITIPITGYPGAAPTFRIMMHPDGVRLGLEALETAMDATIGRTAELLQKLEAVRRLLLGSP